MGVGLTYPYIFAALSSTRTYIIPANGVPSSVDITLGCVDNTDETFGNMVCACFEMKL